MLLSYTQMFYLLACGVAVVGQLVLASEPCPINPSIITNMSKCESIRTGFCYKNNCRRCCYFHNSCNPHPGLLVSREKCRQDLCRPVKCTYPGEYCDLTKDNAPKCHCPESCPEDQFKSASVCGTDGLTYKSVCALNRTSCLLGMHITVKFTGSCDLQSRYLFISPLHKNTAILELNQPGKIQCLFLGDPISITWTKLEIDSLPLRMIPIKDTLVIPQVRIADEGTYRCEAYNGLSIVEAFVKVTVDYDSENMNLDYSKRPKASCLLPLRYGYCTQHDVRWYFDAATRTCQPFVYSGCGRNENNFKKEKQCKSACGHWAGDICQLPKKRGPCKAYIPRWHYDKDKAQCTRFIYGGCRGNANRFFSKLSCEAKCRAQKGYLSPCIKLYMNAVNSHRKGLFRPRCTSGGEFQKTQCHDSVCFCMDENGVEMQGTRVPNGQYINCTSKANHCLTQRKTLDKNPFSGQHVPQCKSDGTYQNVQCSPLTGQCWCVDAAGNEMSGTRTRGPLICPSLDAELTNCQSHYIENAKSPRNVGFVTQCATDGRYLPVQCRGDSNVTCSCVDQETGELRRGTDISITLGFPQCLSSGGLTLCQRMHQEAIRHPEMSNFIPQCTEDGRFEHVQCDPDTKACWCVDRKGMEIAGSKVQGNLICPDIDSKLSQCQRRYQHSMKRLTYKINHHAPRCKPDGSYEEIQCHGRTCHCVDNNGVEIPHTRVNGLGRKPNCTHPDSNVTPCEKARYLSMKTNKFVPRCLPDGGWPAIQCEHTTSLCWCTDNKGNKIKETESKGPVICARKGSPNKKKGSSQCWVEYVAALRSSRRSRRLPWCRDDGKYNPMQCHGSFCYCVTENGVEVPGSKLSIATGRPNCQSSGDNLTPCQLQYRGAMLSGFLGSRVPRCKTDGQYEEVQCQAGTSLCWCVDENGKELPGTRTTKGIKCPVIGRKLLPCQQKYLAYVRNLSPEQMKPRCTLGGEFEPVQCKQSYCFCVDEKGREIDGTRLNRLTGKPVCNRKEKKYLTLCQQEVHKTLSEVSKQHEAPRCKRDGSYEEVQCSRFRKECWCVDEQGREVTKTRTKGYIKCPSEGNVLTSCQQAYQKTLRRSFAPNFVPQCTSDGHYDPIQCLKDNCYCVNEYGVEIANSRISGNKERPNCQQLVNSPTLCQQQLQLYIHSDDHRQLEPSCNADGSYRDIQCYGSQCYCVNSRGVEILGTRKNFIDGKPNCEKESASLTVCQQYLQEAILNPSNVNGFVARCTKDGQFEPIQCNNITGECWCVETSGEEIEDTRTKGIPQCTGLGVTACWRDYIRSSNTSLQGSFTPWCTRNGAYEQLQVQGSRYFCVNDLGLEILGTTVSVMEEKPNCKAAASPGLIPSPCQQEQIRQKYTPRTSDSYTPRCKTDGSYDEIQCDATQGQCWCVDKDGLELDGMRTTGLLICPSKAPLTRCQAERLRSLESLDSPVKLFIPRCNIEGGFEEIQCHGMTGQCWCVDVNGIEIIGSVTFGTKPDCTAKAKMTSCERHRVVAMGMTGKPSPSRYVPQCTHEGKYNEVQCHTGTGLCWCVDTEGREIIGTRAWGHQQCKDTPTDSNTLPLDIAVLFPPTSSKTTLRAIQTFLRSLVSSFEVSHRGTHFSFVVSSEAPYAPLTFSKFGSEDEFTAENTNKVIDGMKIDFCASRVDRGVHFIDQQIFTVLSGMRGLADKVLIVLIDNQQAPNQGRYTPLSTLSEDLQSKNINVYAIGISNQVDVAELMDIASAPRNVFTLKDYENLALNGKEIVHVINNDTRNYLKVEKLCNLPVQTGRLGCLANIRKWYYNSLTGQCLQFTYSGCGGNANNFATYEKCREKCGGILPMCYEVKRQRVTKFLDQYRPSCHQNGDYAAMQCYGGYCWCANKDGVERSGTRVKGIPVCTIVQGRTTACLKERLQALGGPGVPSIGRHAPDCDSNGNYRATQTNGNSEFRWCVDPAGYPVTGTQRWGKLNCTEAVHRLRSHRKVSGKTQCERESIKSDLLDNGRRLFKPACKQDGGYEEIQCYGSVCWCVDHHGNEIMGTRQRGTPNCTQVALLSKCHREYKRSMILRGVTPLGYFLPQCTSDGQFEPVQCHSATGYCWCVDKAGNELAGTRQWGRPNCTNVTNQTVCQFRREECEDNQVAGHFIPKCGNDGSFVDLQCLESMGECWCVDHYGYELPGTRTSSNYRPNCGLLAWLSPCQIQRRKALGPDGLPVVGLFVPECKSDGSYEPVQCHHHDNGDKVCWCADGQGVEVLGSRRRPGVRPFCGKRSLCNELRDYYSSSNTSRFVPQCKRGRFKPVQCQHFKNMPEICWCVDEYGNEVYSTMSSKKQNCSDPGLTVCQHGHNKALIEGKAIVSRCNIDGSYADMQCNTKTRECWCVDRYNNEIKNSRRTGQVTCESREDKRVCNLPVDAGPCESNLLRWFYNSKTKRCAAFVYGGCVGNENKFIDHASCQEQCKGVPLTSCQQEQSLSEVLTNQRKPSCNVNGSYKQVQCNNVTKQCWCVDKGGREVTGYRTTNGTTPECPRNKGLSSIHGHKWHQ